MTKRSLPRDLTSQEYRQFILPTAAAGLLVLAAFLLSALLNAEIFGKNRVWLTLLATAAAIYITVYSFYIIPIRKNKETLAWANAVFSGLWFWGLAFLLDDEFIVYHNLLLFTAVIAISIFAGRAATFTMIGIATASHLVLHPRAIVGFDAWVRHLGVPLISVIFAETTARIQDIARAQVRRLEIVNAFSREIASSLDRAQIIERLNTAIPNALTADSYYVTAMEAGMARVLLCYDEGEYFQDICIPAKGTLTNWIVENQRELFLPDLRQPVELEGVELIIIGKEKTSLSWMGVPMISPSFKGVLALASYEPNAFNRGDLELLSSLASHAALAFENAARHAEAEERARLDSLTGVFNHGYFLKTLRGLAADSLASSSPLSLIMLDVDHFKKYNDAYGHLAGDTILTLLSQTIRRHIKESDAVGRWGGEEFAVALRNVTARQAQAVAKRIGDSMRALTIRDRDGGAIPAPTVSQGIALFPDETRDAIQLIDLADQRLFAAKNRGRDEIEPAPL